jgi:hypothetical protein
MKRTHSMTRRNNSVKQKNYAQLTQGLSEVNIGHEYQLDVKRNTFVRVASVCARPEITHRPDSQKGNLYNSAIRRSYSRSNTEPTEQERYKEMNQRTSTVINNSVQRPVIKRSNSVPIGPERQKETNQQASTVLESNACKPVISINKSESAFTESTGQDRQKEIKQPTSTIINSSALKRTMSPMDMMTESVNKKGQGESCECPTEVTRVSKYQPVFNRSDNRAHNSVIVKVTEDSGRGSSTVRNRKLYQSVVNWIISTETVTNSVNGLGPKDVTQRPLQVRRVSEYQPVINSSTHRVTEDNSGSQKGESVMTQCLSELCADQPTINSTKLMYEAKNPVGQRVRGQVTVRPLIIETGTVYQVVINRPVSQGASNDSEGPLAGRDVGACQPASDGSAESDCECQESLKVAPQHHVSVKDGYASRKESVDARAFFFLYVSVLTWVLLILLWLCK